MTVRELKEKLDEYNDESSVFVFDNVSGYCVPIKEAVTDDDGDIIITFD